MKFYLVFLLIGLVAAEPLFARTVEVSRDNMEHSLNEALENAEPGTEILLPEGRFKMQNELVITKPGITLRGRGMDKSILSFREQKMGSQGVYGHADALTFSDFAIEDSAGNGLKVAQADGVSFIRVRITWTDGPKEQNGAYGLYPVQSHNVLIDGCEVSGASDAGVYVGQSQNIIVKNNKVFHNVAGIEIENSRYADVFDNHTFDNTAGILIFNLPDLAVKGGRQTRVFNNKVEHNNHLNFATEGSIVSLVSEGLGIFVMANSEVEIFNNTVTDNKLAAITATHYAISERKSEDAAYDPMPRHLYIHDNVISERTFSTFRPSKMNIIIKILLGLRTPEILYDGIEDGTYSGKKLAPEDRICIQNNKLLDGSPATFGNLHLDNKRPWYPFPGGPVTRDLEPHNCSFPSFPEVKLGSFPRIPAGVKPSPEKIKLACKRKTNGVNWAALEYDCPELSDYNLFMSPESATADPQPRGFEYTLNNELFSDYAQKNRFIFLPPGTQMQYRASGVLDFPPGTVITKTFSFPLATGLTPIETRLLIKRASGWSAVDYRWQGNRAHLMLEGEVVPLTLTRPFGKTLDLHYGIPNRRQCASCHTTDSASTRQIFPIGPKAKFLNWKGQLLSFEKLGFLKGLPDMKEVPQTVSWQDIDVNPYEKRAKAYLEINCAHCHSPRGPAASTNLYLSEEIPTGKLFGVCKHPVAAGMGSGGRPYDITPGHPEDSILFYRLQHSHLAVRMPQLGRTVEHAEANKMLFNWIAEITGKCD